MKKKLVFTLAILAVAVSAGYYYLRQSKTPAVAPSIWVHVEKVKAESLPLEVAAIGNITAKIVEISPEQAGHVESIEFADGQRVNKGDKLVRLDDDAYKARYQSSLADYTYKQNNFKRKKKLSNKGLISSDTMDEAESLLKQKKAELEQQQALLDKMTLRAPFSGVVGKAKVSSGDYVNVGTSLVTLTDDKNLRVEYALPEDYVSKLVAGQDVKVKSKAYPDKTFTAKLAFISPNITVKNRTVNVYASINNESGALKPGMLVLVKHNLGSLQQAAMVPAKSLVPALDGEQVFKVVKDKAYAVPVSIGQRTANAVQILKGASIGDEIVTDGQLKLRNGSAIKIKR